MKLVCTYNQNFCTAELLVCLLCYQQDPQLCFQQRFESRIPYVSFPEFPDVVLRSNSHLHVLKEFKHFA